MHEFIRNEIKERLGEEIAEKVRIIFGGNVDENNCNELILLKDVDGFLVGEPSIKATFNPLCYQTGKSNNCKLSIKGLYGNIKG